MPYVAYKDKGKIFTLHYDTVFPADTTSEEAILVWRIGEAAERAVSEALQDAIKNGNDLDALTLKRGGRLFVVWVMGRLIEHRNGANYPKALKREVVTSAKTATRLAVYAKVAVLFYMRITRTMLGSGGSTRLAQILRTQDTFAQLRTLTDEEFNLRAIEGNWVESMPLLKR